MANVVFLKGESVALTSIAGEHDYELLLEWATSGAGVHASGTKPDPTLDEMKAYAQQPGARIVIIRTADGRPIGFIRWRELAYPGSIELGCMIGDDALWGAGYAMEAVILILDYLFHERNVHRVQMQTGTFNKAMVQIMCSGVVHIDGILRDFFFLDGAYHDAVAASILRDEYYSLMAAIDKLPTDTIPKADKEEAKEMLAKHLAGNPISIS